MNMLRKDRILLAAFLILLVVFGALLARKFFVSRSSVPPPATAQPAEQASREVILYFGALQGTHLAPEAREVDNCLNDQDCLQATVRALINGPVGSLIPIFPSQTILRDLRVSEGTATVDFGGGLAAAHPGGSVSELFTVYGLVNTLAVNFPHVRQVRILLEGEAVDSLKGHVALRDPVKADFRYSRSPEDAAEERPVLPQETRP